MVLGRRVGLALPGILIAMLAATAGPSHAVPPPDSARLEQMGAEGAKWNRFRVFTTRGRHDLKSLTADSVGVLLGEIQKRSALIQEGTYAPDEPRRAHWSEIEKIEGSRSRVAVGFIAGGIVGLLVTNAVVTKWANAQSSEDSGLAVLALAPIGIAIGGFVGASIASATGWHQVYP